MSNLIIIIGLPLIVMGGITWALTAGMSSLTCNFSEKDYINSQYYNQTHYTLKQAIQACQDLGSQFELIPIGMMIIGLIMCLIALFPKNPSKQQNKPEVNHE